VFEKPIRSSFTLTFTFTFTFTSAPHSSLHIHTPYPIRDPACAIALGQMKRSTKKGGGATAGRRYAPGADDDASGSLGDAGSVGGASEGGSSVGRSAPPVATTVGGKRVRGGAGGGLGDPSGAEGSGGGVRLPGVQVARSVSGASAGSAGGRSGGSGGASGGGSVKLPHLH
jgi:hypothetical protein